MTDVQDKTETAQEQADEALRRFADGLSWLPPPRSCTRRPGTAWRMRT
jgi:hypothetical protein